MDIPQFVKELPEDYECKDITDLFTYKHIAWRKATKKQRKKFKGLYGIVYNGRLSRCTTGLLRLIARCIFYKKRGFVLVSENQTHNEIEYVVV